MTRILIADDHPIFRNGLKFLLQSELAACQIVECDNGLAVIEQLKNYIPDILILDIDMPGKNGLEVCEIITNRGVRSKIIILTMYDDESMMREALRVGAHGYLIKDNTADELVTCIDTILKGERYITRELKTGTNEAFAPQFELMRTLSPVELKTLQLVNEHYPSKEIADLLFVSVKSVENYRSRICKKLKLDPANNALLKWVNEHSDAISAFKG